MGLPVFLGEVPEYECDASGRVRIIVGDFVMVMPPHVFLDGCELGKAAIVDWQRQKCGIPADCGFVSGEVIPFPQR